MNFLNKNIVNQSEKLSYLHDEKQNPARDPELEAFLKLSNEIKIKLLKIWSDQKETEEVDEKNKELDVLESKLAKKSEYIEIVNDANHRANTVKERLRLKLLKKHNLA